jgi:hypothetical protein
MQAYRSRSLDKDLRQLNESLVEVLDSFCSILGRLVSDIANATVWEELDVSDREFGEVLAHILLRELGRKAAHKDTGRLHGSTVKTQQMRAQRAVVIESCSAKMFRDFEAAPPTLASPIGRRGRLVAPAVSH